METLNNFWRMLKVCEPWEVHKEMKLNGRQQGRGQLFIHHMDKNDVYVGWVGGWEGGTKIWLIFSSQKLDVTVYWLFRKVCIGFSAGIKNQESIPTIDCDCVILHTPYSVLQVTADT